MAEVEDLFETITKVVTMAEARKVIRDRLSLHCMHVIQENNALLIQQHIPLPHHILIGQQYMDQNI